MYDDIINVSRYVSDRKHMSLYKRAAQFAPFAALNGYYDSINEVSKVSSDRKVLIEEEKAILNNKLNLIKSGDLVSITYFVCDKFKEGGKYISRKGSVRKVDKYSKMILIDDFKISFFDIVDIDM